MMKLEQSKKHLFGNKESEDFYHSCLKTANDIDIGYFYRVIEKKNIKEIIICNMFKLKIIDNNYSFYKYLIKSKRWQNLEQSKITAYKCFLITRFSLIENTTTIYSRFLQDAIEEIIYRKQDELKYTVFDEKNKIGFSRLRSIITKKILKKTHKPNANQLGRSFMKMIWNNVVSKDVYSYCMRIYLKPPTLQQYLHVAKMNYDSLCRISHEYPNLFPVLAFLKPSDVERADLFSKKLWVISDQNSIPDTHIDLPIYFTNKSTWNFFRQLSSRLVIYFLCNNRVRGHAHYGELIIESLILIKDIKKQQVNVINCVQLLLFRVIHELEQIPKKFMHVLMNAMMEEILSIRDRITPSVFRKHFSKNRNTEFYLFVHQFRDIIDYLINNPDIHLRKNKTFDRLLDDARQWEQMISMAKNEKLMSRNRSKLLPDTQIGAYQIKELNNGYDVFLEGKAMHHCIQMYISRAEESKYKIFSILNSNNPNDMEHRATLGAIFSYDNNIWELEQIRGVCNGEVSENIIAISQQIISTLNEAKNA